MSVRLAPASQKIHVIFFVLQRTVHSLSKTAYTNVFDLPNYWRTQFLGECVTIESIVLHDAKLVGQGDPHNILG